MAQVDEVFSEGVIEAPVGQNGHDLPRWQRRELRLVAGEQDPLTLLVTQAVRNEAVAAFTAIGAVPITGELTPPALQGAEPHAKESGHFTGPFSVGHGGIEDLEGLAAILG